MIIVVMVSVIYWGRMVPLVVVKLHSQWEWMRGKIVQCNDGTTLWEDGELTEKLEVVVIKEDSGFGGPGWSRSVDMA